MKSWKAKISGAEFKLMRLQETVAASGLSFDEPQDIVDYLRPQLDGSPRYSHDTENLLVVHLNARGKPIGWEVISNGDINSVMVHPREVFKAAIVMNSFSIILAHNHPSGDPSPSDADIKVTREIIRAGKLMKIDVLDHIILGSIGGIPRPPGWRETDMSPAFAVKGYSSLKELGYFHC